MLFLVNARMPLPDSASIVVHIKINFSPKFVLRTPPRIRCVYKWSVFNQGDTIVVTFFIYVVGNNVVTTKYLD